jgi:hypothetical protein
MSDPAQAPNIAFHALVDEAVTNGLNTLLQSISDKFGIDHEELTDFVYETPAEKAAPAKKQPTRSRASEGTKKAEAKKVEAKKVETKKEVKKAPKKEVEVTTCQHVTIPKKKGAKKVPCTKEVVKGAKYCPTHLKSMEKKPVAPSATEEEEAATQIVKKFKVHKNRFGNYENPETHIVFDHETKMAKGKQASNGKIVELGKDEIAFCKSHGWSYKFDSPPAVLKRKNKAKESEEELSDEDDEDEEEEEEEEDDDEVEEEDDDEDDD